MKKAFRFSIRIKILIGILIVNILSCTIMGIAIYRYVSDRLIASVATETIASCRMAAYLIDGDFFAILDKGCDDYFANKEIKKELDDILAAADINAIYTIAERDGQMVYLTQQKLLLTI